MMWTKRIPVYLYVNGVDKNGISLFVCGWCGVGGGGGGGGGGVLELVCEISW